MSIKIDSRTVKRGDTFIAIKGKRFDGHDFVKEAFDRGAGSAVVSRRMELPRRYAEKLVKASDTVEALGEIAKAHRLKFKIPVIAITGSNGKTTAKDMLSFVLSARYNVLKNESSKNNLIGLPLTLLGLNKRHEVAVVEMGMNRMGEIGRLSEIAMPGTGVVTNIAPAHLEFLGTLKNVFTAKSELLRGLSARDTAVLNGDDRYLRNIKGLKCGRVYFGIERRCHVRATGLVYRGNRWCFSVFPPTAGVEGGVAFEVPLLGRHNVYNALIAIAVAREFGMEDSVIAGRLKLYRAASPMRLELKRVSGLAILDDSYNSNPLSMEAAIDTLLRYDTRGKRIVVSGDMLELGKDAKAMHQVLGRKIAERGVDFLITVGTLAKFVNKAAREKGMVGVYHAESHRKAALCLKSVVKPGDVVLVKGSRAAEMEKVIGMIREEHVIPFIIPVKGPVVRV